MRQAVCADLLREDCTEEGDAFSLRGAGRWSAQHWTHASWQVGDDTGQQREMKSCKREETGRSHAIHRGHRRC